MIEKKSLPNAEFMRYYTRKTFLHELATALLRDKFPTGPKYVIRIRGVHDVQ